MDGWGGGVKCSRGGVEPSLSLVAASLLAVLPSLKQLPFHLDKLITESLRSPLPHHHYHTTPTPGNAQCWREEMKVDKVRHMQGM